MANTREYKGRFSRLVNRQEPLRLLNFLKVKVLRLRHRRRKPTCDGLGTSPTSLQDTAVDNPVAVSQTIHWARDKKHNLTSFHGHDVENEQQGSDQVSKPTAGYHHSSNSIHELINLTGAVKPTFIQGCIELASPKDAAPVLKFELVFGAGFPRDNISCYEAWVPAEIGDAGRRLDCEFRRGSIRKRSRLWAPDARTLPGPSRRFACPYLAHDPATYEGRKSCRGAAFSEISRLKEHLYRCHEQRPHCTKCGEPFIDVSDQVDHGACSSTLMRGDFPKEFEGFDEEQEMKLKDKKRKRGESNEEKWKDIFNVLFPDAIETSNLYYRSRAIENCQDETADPDDMKHGIIKNLFADHQAPDIESMARSRMEKMTGSLPEEDWREMKKIFRDFAFAGLESQTSVCSSSKFSASHQVPNTRLNSGQDSREILNHEDALPPESQPQLPLPTREAAEHSPDPHLEATSETYEESVFNNLNLTPEECLAAALQQKTPPWQGPEDVSSHY